jgi:hypothetical protein
VLFEGVVDALCDGVYESRFFFCRFSKPIQKEKVGV